MQRTFDAVYENGLLRPLESLRLAECQRVSLIIDEAQSGPVDEHLLDHELLRSLDEGQFPEVTLEQVRATLAKIPGSMTSAFIAEREERF